MNLSEQIAKELIPLEKQVLYSEVKKLEEENKKLKLVWDAVAAVKERWRGSTISTEEIAKNNEFWSGMRNIITVYDDALKESKSILGEEGEIETP